MCITRNMQWPPLSLACFLSLNRWCDEDLGGISVHMSFHLLYCIIFLSTRTKHWHARSWIGPTLAMEQSKLGAIRWQRLLLSLTLLRAGLVLLQLASASIIYPPLVTISVQLRSNWFRPVWYRWSRRSGSSSSGNNNESNNIAELKVILVPNKLIKLYTTIESILLRFYKSSSCRGDYSATSTNQISSDD